MILREDKDNIELGSYCESLKGECFNGRVLLVQLPQFIIGSFNKSIARNNGYYVFPPVGLMCLAEALKYSKMSIRIFDMNLEILKRNAKNDMDIKLWLDLLRSEIAAFKPSFVGVSCMYDSGIEAFIEVLRLLKEETGCIVAAGGVVATYEYERLLRGKMCHFVVKGEGEEKIVALLNMLRGVSGSHETPRGICFNSSGHLWESCGADDAAPFDTDMTDSYRYVDLEDYSRCGSLNPFSRMACSDGRLFMTVQRNRGCRACCTFCSAWSFMGKKIRSRPARLVLKEIEYLVNEKGVRHFEWLDDDLLHGKDEFKSILRSIIDKGWGISWSAYNGLIAASLDEELLDLMQRSGCCGFKLGVETGNSDMLKKIRKPATIEIYRRTSRMLKDYRNMFVAGNYILGFPGESFSQMMDTFRLYLDLDFDWGSFLLCQAIRGASAFADFEDYFTSQMESGGVNARHFIPTRESSSGKLYAGPGGVVAGPGVFEMDGSLVPGQEQLKEIWFTFNLVGNFIFNKNLAPRGIPRKFITWTEMAQIAYPPNPYMQAFLALAYVLENDLGRAAELAESAKRIVCKDDYWRQRFSLFRLDPLIYRPPQTRDDVFRALDDIKCGYIRSLGLKEICVNG
jgi:radical SAM superfamily enzyme YgiQ (UPF0313 family)